jgi:subtilisin family serine protease
VLTVGAFDAAVNSGMWPCSSGGNPKSVNNDRQKPELAAPGRNVTTTNTTSGFTNLPGATSFAAPMVTGSVGLLLQRNPVLGSWPEAVRAIFMATAIHDREGTGVLSEFDGVGGIAADEADGVADLASGAVFDTPTVACKGEEQFAGRTNFTKEQLYASRWRGTATPAMA